MPEEELAKVTARYTPDNESGAWMAVNEQFIFHRTHTQQEQARRRWTKAVRRSCLGRRILGCIAKGIATLGGQREGQPSPASFTPTM